MRRLSPALTMVAFVRHAASFTLSRRRLSTFASLPPFAAATSSNAPITTSCRATSNWSHTMMSASAGSMEVAQFPCLDDNYGYLIHDPKTGQTAAIDTPCAASYKRELEKRGWALTHILCTHHHADHVGGNGVLKTEGVHVYGPADDGNIPGMDTPLKENDSLSFGGAKAKVMGVGGHTLGHIAYYFPEEKTAFVGDALFSLGCGRMFEGTPDQFWESLQKLRSLPDDTTVYCAHEYTESNAKFAMSVEPGNANLVRRAEEIRAKRAKGDPTVPSLMGEEKMTNPFLRGDISEEIQRNVGAIEGEDGATIFHKIRLGKDNFRG